MKKVPFLLTLSLVCSFIFLTTSCSTIINGSRQDVSIKATPAEAKIYVDGELAGTGRTDIKLKRGKDHVIEVRLDGYRTTKVTTDKTITGWFWGNLICGGILGGAIDLITGSAFDVDPDVIAVTLESGTGLLDVPVGKSFGIIDARTASGERVAVVSVEWE